ncbi:MAG TPA: hypothetical protein VII84_04925 [Acidimicrobiales bacterium]
MLRRTRVVATLLSLSLTACASGAGAPLTRPMESIPFASTLDINLVRRAIID